MTQNKQMQVLQFIIEREGELSQSEIARYFDISKERIRQIFNSLEKKHYIKLFGHGKYQLLLVDKTLKNKLNKK